MKIYSKELSKNNSMKEKIISLTKNLLSTNSEEKLLKNKEEMLALFDQNNKNENFFFCSLVPILEEDYGKMLKILKENQDENIEQEKLRIVFILSAVINLI